MFTVAYILKSGALFSLFYMVYYLFFRNNTMFQLNRAYLLLIAPISLLLPQINWERAVSTQYEVTLPTVFTAGAESQTIYTANYNNLGFIYTTIAVILLAFLMVKLTRMGFLIYKLKRGQKLDLLPFSFFSFVYIPDNMEHDKKEAIIKHEMVHVKELHSIDVLTYEIVKILFWWTPFAWMASKSVRNNHEFIADAKASKENKNNYSSVLLAQLLGVNCSMLANNFNYKPLIKRRIKMMKTAKSKKVTALKYALIIPIAALFATVTVNQPVQAQSKKVVKNNNDDKVYEQVDVMPEFEGGMNGLMSYMGNSIKYPKDSKAEGKVFVSFVVDEKGNVNNVEVVKGVDMQLDKEAMRVVKAMPKWAPGKVADKAVKVKMTLPIMFKLS